MFSYLKIIKKYAKSVRAGIKKWFKFPIGSDGYWKSKEKKETISQHL
jgi:hypothetical protein